MRGATLGGARLFQTDLVEEFFRALVGNARITAHFDLIRGANDHHAIEALFKAFALALREATRMSGAPRRHPFHERGALTWRGKSRLWTMAPAICAASRRRWRLSRPRRMSW